MIEFEEKCVCLSALAKPYSMAGNEGISYKIRFNINGEIYSCYSNKEQVEYFQQFIGKTGDGVFQFNSPKESLKMLVKSFTV